jgi:tetratricopeptide (TPR) repeat protein
MRFQTFLPIVLAAALSQCFMGQESLASQSAGLQTHPPDPELAKARELLERADLTAAEVAARQYISKHANSPDGHFLLGLIFFREVQSQARASGEHLAPGDIPAAVVDSKVRDAKIRDSLASFTEGAKFGRPSAFDLKIVSLDYVLLGDYASAGKWLTLALQWDPSDAEAWYYLGRAKYNENRFEEAIQAFQKCLEIRPRHVLAGDGLGLSYAGLSRSADAIATLQNAISWQENSDQKSPEPLIDLGDLFNQQARFEEALPVLQKAVAIAPRNIRAHETLGKTFLNLNRLLEAQHELEAAVSGDPNRPALHYLLGQIYRKQGQLEKAKSEMDRFQTLKANEPPPKPGMQ